MLTDTLQKQIQVAFKSGDELKTTTLKLLFSALHNGEIAKIAKLTEDEEIAIVQKEVKKRRDAIALYKEAGALERAAREEAEIGVLQDFLPTQMTEAELTPIVEAAILNLGAASVADMGKVIGAVKASVGAKAPGALIAEIVKAKLLK